MDCPEILNEEPWNDTNKKVMQYNVETLYARVKYDKIFIWDIKRKDYTVKVVTAIFHLASSIRL